MARRSAPFALPSLAVLALGGCDPAVVSTTDLDGDGYIDPADSECWEAATLLDVSAAPGPGAGYAKPWISGSCDGGTFVVESNGLPHYTFVQLTPNALTEADHRWEIPRDPQPAAQATDIPLLGQVAFTVGGTSIFGPNEAAQPAATAWGDPVYNGITDGCYGHTAFEYHNHALVQRCLTPSGLVAEPWTQAAASALEPSPVIGWALDGFPIYGPHGCVDAACTEVVEFVSGYRQVADPSADVWDAYVFEADDDERTLDECNGRFGPDGSYRYHATSGWPYVLGCYRGTPVDAGDQQGGGPGGPL